MTAHRSGGGGSSGSYGIVHNGHSSNNSGGGGGRPVDFSYCIMWSPLPPITFFLPFIGHMGICDSRGVVHDFRGSYYVGQDGNAVMAFGPTTRYLKMDVGEVTTAIAAVGPPPPGGGAGPPLETPAAGATPAGAGAFSSSSSSSPPRGTAERWDEAIREADDAYGNRIHNICCDNCHSHVARALNVMPYGRKNAKWDMVKLCFLVFFRAKFVSVWSIVYQFLPFTIFVVLVVVFTNVA
jgi:transmembrane protein 222